MTTTDDVRRIPLTHADGSESPLLVVAEDTGGRDSGKTPTPVVLVLPGVAVGARYYLPLARALAAAGVDTAVTELRGQGESTHRVGRRGVAGYHETAAEDVPLALDALAAELGDRPVVLLGHSMGAQKGLYHLARRDPRVVGLVAVASQIPHHRHWPAPASRRLHLGSVLLPAIGRVLGHVPATVFGGQGRQPVTRIRDWARLAGRGVMQPARADIDYPAALGHVTVPVLAVVIAGDTLAPESAARGLLGLVPAARTSLEVEPTELGHNQWAREPERVVERVVAWMGREGLGR